MRSIFHKYVLNVNPTPNPAPMSKLVEYNEEHMEISQNLCNKGGELAPYSPGVYIAFWLLVCSESHHRLESENELDADAGQDQDNRTLNELPGSQDSSTVSLSGDSQQRAKQTLYSGD